MLIPRNYYLTIQLSTTGTEIWVLLLRGSANGEPTWRSCRQPTITLTELFMVSY